MKQEDNDKYVLYCGTCKYKKGNRCKNIRSDCWRDVVTDDCSCECYVPRKGILL